MIDAEQREILRVLQEGVDALADALRDIDEPTARRRPVVNSWSVLECVQHIAMTEAALFVRLREAKACDASSEDRAREAKFEGLALNRSRRIEAPDLVIPKTYADDPENNSGSLAQALEQFNAVRSETIQFVENFQGDLRWWQAQHPLIARPVNCYEMLLLVALHPKRHAQQIVETRSALAHAHRKP
jgi:hypothetical protein